MNVLLMNSYNFNIETGIPLAQISTLWTVVYWYTRFQTNKLRGSLVSNPTSKVLAPVKVHHCRTVWRSSSKVEMQMRGWAEKQESPKFSHPLCSRSQYRSETFPGHIKQNEKRKKKKNFQACVKSKDSWEIWEKKKNFSSPSKNHSCHIPTSFISYIIPHPPPMFYDNNEPRGLYTEILYRHYALRATFFIQKFDVLCF